jgi:hypothetical protein
MTKIAFEGSNTPRTCFCRGLAQCTCEAAAAILEKESTPGNQIQVESTSDSIISFEYSPDEECQNVTVRTLHDGRSMIFGQQFNIDKVL